MTYVDSRFGKRIDCDFDVCGEQLEADEFHELIDLMKEEGWRSIKLDDRWQHLCPEHRDETI